MQRWLTQSYCVNANLRLLWPNATQPGDYDIVADFGNNTANPATFVPDDHYDMPLDIIDGYVVPGFKAGVMPDFSSLGDQKIADLVAFLTQKS